MLKADAKRSKPRWRRPLWLAVLLTAITIRIVSYFLFQVPPERVLGGLALTFLMVSLACYVRIKPSRKVSRAMYMTLGAWGAYLAILFGGAFTILATGRPRPTTFLGPWASFVLFSVAPWIVGAFIGDWVGRRRNYRIPLSIESEVAR